MKRIAFALALGLATPLAAQTPPEVPPDTGFSLIERGAQMLMQQFLNEVGPRLGEVQDGLEEAMAALEPALRELLTMIGDIRYYEAPERLPNGDILLRRKPGAPQLPVPLAPGESLDL
ncbi:MAG: AAA+ family ATPase [Phaeovulum sp.]|jgi:hypothetical protein|uniref:AAA+ family ATPase n=1 Tax=Phaeovulum sp. TaxID=2934796 RepID=UPI002732C34A|nr:AAA+ family ATPase [Phaeovulum sp.]MDP3861348.1 AAA+ family ATPase [Phaeovulum sp.]